MFADVKINKLTAQFVQMLWKGGI